MTSTTVPLAYTIAEAAEATRTSQDTIRRAIAATNARSFPPPLKAKRVGTGPRAKHVILADDLADWMTRLPNA